MTLPDAVRAGVEAALGDAVRDVARVSGGCISAAARIEAGSGAWFLKWADAPSAMFAAEARGLAALAASGAVRVPAVEATGDRWLLLEWLEPGAPDARTWPELGKSLAALHAVRADAFGAEADNFIGSLPQSNRRHTDWAAFWRAERLAPQLVRARTAFRARAADRLQRFVDEGLAPLLAAGAADGPSLLHGDLWSGNVHIVRGGRAALVDPSAHHGHREVDLAMAALFGGFGAAFFDAYAAAWPLTPGWPERRAAYQLYYLLVHVNLFGTGYVAQTLAALDAAGG